MRLRIGSHRIQLACHGGHLVAAGQPPEALPPAAHSVMMRVADTDAHFAQASAAGAEVLAEPMDYPYGERQYTARDLGGHIWTFSQSVADVDPAQWGGELLPE